MTQVLSSEEIKDLLKDPTSADKSYKPRWPKGNDKVLILTALENRDERVELSDGWYNIRYSEGFTYKTETTKKHSTAFVQKEGQLRVPCGWFDKDNLRKELNGNAADDNARAGVSVTPDNGGNGE